MNKREVFFMIYSNKHNRNAAVVYISDFLCVSKEQAERIYDREYKAFLEDMRERA